MCVRQLFAACLAAAFASAICAVVCPRRRKLISYNTVPAGVDCEIASDRQVRGGQHQTLGGYLQAMADHDRSFLRREY
jgi:hypothetical protein